jgi:hypothetical protein
MIMCAIFKPGSTDDQSHISSLIGVQIHSFKTELLKMQKMKVSAMLEQRVHNALFAVPE